MLCTVDVYLFCKLCANMLCKADANMLCNARDTYWLCTSQALFGETSHGLFSCNTWGLRLAANMFKTEILMIAASSRSD